MSATPPESPLSPTITSLWQRAFRKQANLTDLLIDMGVQEMKELTALRARGYQEESLDRHFDWQKSVAKSPPVTVQRTWFRNMRAIMGEIDHETACVNRDDPTHFLDLGCAPGGFASYILGANPSATGVGVTLHRQQGGHNIHLEGYLRPRMEILFEDMLKYDLSPPGAQSPVGLLPSSLIAPASFDLVLLDGHFLWEYAPGGPGTAGTAPQWSAQQLLVVQLVLALHALKHGGTVVFKLTQPERLITAKLLALLDALSATLVTMKPRTMHASRGSFYAVAKGVGMGVGGADRSQIEYALRCVWRDIITGGDEGNGRWMYHDDLDWVATEEELCAEFLPRLIELAVPVWTAQIAGLRELFEKKGVRIDGM